MSRVYFNDGTAEAELRGSERAYAGHMVDQAALLVLDPFGFGSEERLKPFLGPDSYVGKLNTGRSFGEEFTRMWRSSRFMGGSVISFEGKPLSPFDIALSTASLLGDQMSILAWIHGQCECHGYVEGEYRSWLADIIDRGRESGIFRRDQGWESVAAFLRQRDDLPVVMSYSVTDGFPDFDAILPEHQEALRRPEDTDPYAPNERFSEEIDFDQQWAWGIEWLRSGAANVGALEPDNIGSRSYGSSITAFTMLDLDRMREELA